MKDLHLFITNECHLNCPLCCNKQYDVEKVPLVTKEDIKNTRMVLLTGGEPLLEPNLVTSTVQRIRQIWRESLFEFGFEVFMRKIIVYTTGRFLNEKFLTNRENVIDGFSISPKGIEDWKNIMDTKIATNLNRYQSNRLYVFDKTAYKYYKPFLNFQYTLVEREWQKEFVPAPNSEFKRLYNLC